MYRIKFEVTAYDPDDSCYEDGDKYKVGRYMLELRHHITDFIIGMGMKKVTLRGPKFFKVRPDEKDYNG